MHLLVYRSAIVHYAHSMSFLSFIRQSWTVALHFAWGDLKARYRRSVLGPLWIVLSTAIGVVGLGVLWSTILKQDRASLIPSLTVGLVVWQFISASVVESTGVFVRQAALIRNINVPFLIFPLQMVLRQLINFLHNTLIIVIVLLIYPPDATLGTVLLALPGLLLVTLHLLWIALFVGILGARFRDLEPLIGAIMPMLFFLSPVIYRPEHLGVDAQILWANPITYLIAVIRDPLQGVVPSWHTYGVTVAMLVVGWTVALWLLNRRKHRIAFWV